MKRKVVSLIFLPCWILNALPTGFAADGVTYIPKYGLSKFALKNGAKAAVEKTYTNDEFYQYITQGEVQ